jgi:hypothetical protein
MALALCLLFDPKSERLVRDLWRRLEDRGVPTLLTHTHRRHPPHLSYAVLRRWTEDGLRAGLDQLPDAGPLDLSAQGSLMFPRGRSALACAISAALAARQERAASCLAAAGGELHRHYEIGRWIPHVSVATRATGSQLTTIVHAVSDLLPITLRADRAALIDTGTGKLTMLTSIP